MNSPNHSAKDLAGLADFSTPERRGGYSPQRSPPPSSRSHRDCGSSVYGPIRGLRLSSRRWQPTASWGSLASEAKLSKDSLGPGFRLRSSSEEIIDLNNKLTETCNQLHKTKQELIEAKSKLATIQSGEQDMLQALKRSLRKAKRENETLQARLEARKEMRAAECEDMEARLLLVVRENQEEMVDNLKTHLARKDLMIDKLKSALGRGARRLQRGSTDMED